MSQSEHILNLDSMDQLGEKLNKLRQVNESLKGKALQLRDKERKLKEKQLRLFECREQVLNAVRELLLEEPSISQNHKLMEKYEQILTFMIDDIESDVDEIMG